jgi:hypothetical protein
MSLELPGFSEPIQSINWQSWEFSGVGEQVFEVTLIFIFVLLGICSVQTNYFIIQK